MKYISCMLALLFAATAFAQYQGPGNFVGYQSVVSERLQQALTRPSKYDILDAARTNDLDKMKTLLAHPLASQVINAREDRRSSVHDGFTALHYAAFEGNVEMLKLILANELRVDKRLYSEALRVAVINLDSKYQKYTEGTGKKEDVERYAAIVVELANAGADICDLDNILEKATMLRVNIPSLTDKAIEKCFNNQEFWQRAMLGAFEGNNEVAIKATLEDYRKNVHRFKKNKRGMSILCYEAFFDTHPPMSLVKELLSLEAMRIDSAVIVSAEHDEYFSYLKELLEYAGNDKKELIDSAYKYAKLTPTIRAYLDDLSAQP